MTHSLSFQVEAAVPEKVRDGPSAYGVLRVQPTTPYNWRLRSMQAVMRDEKSGGWIAAADLLRGWHAAGH